MIMDRYTKTVLTVIAFCLVYLCLATSPLATATEAQVSVTPGSRNVLHSWVDATGKEWRFPVPTTYTNEAAPLPVVSYAPPVPKAAK